MKKLILWLIALACLLGFLPLAYAQENGYWSMIDAFDSPYLYSAAVADGVLYGLDGDGRLFAFHESGTATLLSTATGAHAVTGGQRLGLIDWQGGHLGILEDSGVQWLYTFDLSVFGDEDYQPYRAIWSEDALYVLFYPSTDAWPDTFVARIDLKTGKGTLLEQQNIEEFALYGPGQLLALLYHPYKMNDSPTPVLLDGLTGAILETYPTLESYGAGGLCYDAAQGYIYVADGGQLLRLDKDRWLPVNYVAQFTMTEGLAAGCLSSGAYVYVDRENVTLRNTDPKAIEGIRPLVVKGPGLSRDMIPRFMREHPAIPLVINDMYFDDMDQFVSNIQSGDSSVDIYVLSDYDGVWRLIDKGFTENLSQYPALGEVISRMNPRAREAVSRNGGYYAMPVTLSFDTWIARPDLLKEAGYTHFPSTLLEYFQMLGEWEDGKKDDLAFSFHALAYSRGEVGREGCLRMAFRQYIVEYEQPDAPLSFDSLAFREVLAAIDDVYPAQSGASQPSGNQEYIWRGTQETIFEWYNTNQLRVGEFHEYEERLLPPPPYEEGTEPKAPASMYLAVINPNSQNKENAALFLTYAAEHPNWDNLVALFPEVNEAVPYPPAIAAIEEMESELVRLDGLLKNADDEHKPDLEAQINLVKDDIADAEKWRFAVTAKAVAEYRRAEQYMVILDQSLFFNLQPIAREPFYDTLNKYAAGSVSADTLIQELNQKMLMVFREQ